MAAQLQQTASHSGAAERAAACNRCGCLPDSPGAGVRSTGASSCQGQTGCRLRLASGELSSGGCCCTRNTQQATSTVELGHAGQSNLGRSHSHPKHSFDECVAPLLCKEESVGFCWSSRSRSSGPGRLPAAEIQAEQETQGRAAVLATVRRTTGGGTKSANTEKGNKSLRDSTESSTHQRLER